MRTGDWPSDVHARAEISCFSEYACETLSRKTAGGGPPSFASSGRRMCSGRLPGIQKRLRGPGLRLRHLSNGGPVAKITLAS